MTDDLDLHTVVEDTDPALRPIVPLTESTHSKLVSVALFVMTACTVFLTGFVVLAIFSGNPEADAINAKLDRQLTLLQSQVRDGIDARNANACTAYQNHRAIEEAIRDIGRLNGIRIGNPRVLPSDETIAACKKVGIAVDGNGIPQVSNLALGDTTSTEQ